MSNNSVEAGKLIMEASREAKRAHRELSVFKLLSVNGIIGSRPALS